MRARDKGVCQLCLLDIWEALKRWKRARPSAVWDAPSGYQTEYASWLKAKPPREEHDHIVPFSEGGLTVVENMRTLCADCHKRRTAEWRASRKLPKTEKPT